MGVFRNNFEVRRTVWYVCEERRWFWWAGESLTSSCRRILQKLQSIKPYLRNTKL